MSAVNLEKSIEKLKKCYVGLEKKTHKLFAKAILDKSKISELEWIVASHRVSLAIKNGEITDYELKEKLMKENK